MRKLNPSKAYHPAGILLCGLAAAHIIATIQVYLSNIKLYRTVTALHDTGYLTVPNVKVMGSLPTFWPAFFGGLFFTCSIGAGMALGSMAAAWIWSGLLDRNRFVLFIFMSIWGGLLLIANIHGWALFTSLYFLLIGPALFLLTDRWVTNASNHASRRLKWLHVVPIPLLALLWFTQFDAGLFVDLRDNLLLTNSLGRKFSQFYYDYTLYPAKAFKSLSQRLIRTCRLSEISSPELQLQIVKRLLANDYLPMPEPLRVDLEVYQEGGDIILGADGRKVLPVKVQQFLMSPANALQKFSEARDRHGALRQFVYLSLLLGFPLLIYITLHFAIYYPAAWFLGRKNSAVVASALCLIAGILVLIYFHTNRSSNIEINDIADALTSKTLPVRIAALKSIQQKRLDAADFRPYPQLLKSPHPQERYWLAVAMAVGRSQATYHDLLGLLEDKSINVRAMAFYSLGVRQNRQAIEPVLEKIRLSTDWYAQLYAYRTLKSLGWKQKRLP